MYSKVLLAVDVSEVSKLLVGQLPNLIKVGLKEVVLVHVVNLREAGDFSEQLKELEDRLNGKGLSLIVTAKAKGGLAQEGYDATYGARPLRRLIQKKLQDEIALGLLNGVYKEGDKVEVGFDPRKEKFIFNRVTKASGKEN